MPNTTKTTTKTTTNNNNNNGKGKSSIGSNKGKLEPNNSRNNSEESNKSKSKVEPNGKNGKAPPKGKNSVKPNNDNLNIELSGTSLKLIKEIGEQQTVLNQLNEKDLNPKVIEAIEEVSEYTETVAEAIVGHQKAIDHLGKVLEENPESAKIVQNKIEEVLNNIEIQTGGKKSKKRSPSKKAPAKKSPVKKTPKKKSSSKKSTCKK